MELFMDRFGGIITIVLAGIVLVMGILGFAGYKSLSARIAYLEGCCEQVQQRLEGENGAAKAELVQYIDQEIEKVKAEQTQTLKDLSESESKALKEEVSTMVTEKISEEVETKVKTEIENSRAESTKKSSGKKSQSKSTSTQTTTTTTTVTGGSAQVIRESQEPSYDPDDKHFVIGSGDDEEED